MRRRAPFGLAALICCGGALLWAFAVHEEERISETPTGSVASPVQVSRSQPRTDALRQAEPVAASIRGRLHSPDGSPLIGGRACVSCADCISGDGFFRPRCVDASPDGHYELRDVAGGGYRVVGTAHGGLLGLARQGADVVVDGDDLDGVDVWLQAGAASVSGHVLDALGGVLPGAEVRASAEHPALPQARELEQAVRAADDGSFSMVVPAGEVWLTASGEGYATAALLVVAPSSEVQLSLSPASRITGQVTSHPEGRPVAGVTIRASSGLTWTDSQPSAADGSFALDDLTPGSYELEAEGDGWIGRYPGLVTVGLGERSTPITVPVIAAASVRGIVVAGDRPCPTGEVELSASPGFDLPHLRASSNLQGEVRFAAAPAGRYRSLAKCQDFPPLQGPDIEVGEDDLEGVRWELPGGAEVNVHARTLEGTAVADSWIQLSPQPRRSEPSLAQPTRIKQTDAAGVSLFRAVGPGRYWVHEPNELPSTGAELEVGGSEESMAITVTVKAGATIELRVRNEQGAALDHMTVSARGQGSEPAALGRSLGRGRYVLGPLIGGHYDLQLGDGINPARRVAGSQPGGLVLVAPATKRSLEYVYETQLATLGGSVSDAAGDPLRDAWVTLRTERGYLDDGHHPLSARGQNRRLTDADGHFEFKGLQQDATYTVTASHDHGGYAKVSGASPGQDLGLKLSAPGSLSGSLVYAHQTSPDYFDLVVRHVESGTYRRARFGPDAAGHWSMQDVAPGALEIVAGAADLGARAEVLLGPAEDLDGVRLQLASPAEPSEVAVSGESSSLTERSQ